MTMKSVAASSLTCAFLLLPAVSAQPLEAQLPHEANTHAAVLAEIYPELYDLLVRVERATGIAFGGLIEEGEAVRATGGDIPTFGWEFDMVARLTELVSFTDGRADDLAEEAEAGYAVLGAQAAETIARTNSFHREVLGILADPSLPSRAEKLAALDAAVQRYESKPEVALPPQPKHMDILYDHPHALDFKTGYLDLAGLIWAGYWLWGAASEPLTDIVPGPEQAAAIDTVMARYHAKLSYGEAPEFFPSELPQTPPIAPGIVFTNPQAAMIWDNMKFMQEVMGDIMATADPIDVHAALDEAARQFIDAEWRLTTRDEWEIMGLRHGIFFQGGYPLAVMTESELNAGGHAAHLSGGGSVPILSGMP